MNPVQIVADPAKIGPVIELTRVPTRSDQLPITGAGGRVPAAGVDVNSPALVVLDGAEVPVGLNIASTSSVQGAIAVQSSLANAPAKIIGTRSQNGLIIDAADEVLQIIAGGNDGVDNETVGYLSFGVDGTPAADAVGGRLDLWLTADGAAGPSLVASFRQNKACTLAGALTVTGTTTVAATQRIVSCLTEVVTAASLVDGGAGLGTKVLTMSIPVGARVVGIDVTVEAGYAGDTTATFKLGDGSDDDRYMTGAPSVFATAAAGIAAGIPSGAVNVLVANTPTMTINSTGTIGLVIAGGGSLTVRVYFIPRS